MRPIKKVVGTRLMQVGLVLLSVLSGTLLCEGGVRLFEFIEGKSPSGIIGPTSNQFEFYQFDPKLGWSNTPGASGIFKRWEFEFPVRINKFGMRSKDVELEPAPGIFRIAVMGDSFTWGLGVSDEDRFTDLLNRPGKIEVLNFGVSGYGPVQYSLQIDDALRFKPNMILICFCLENDFLDNVLGFNYGYFHPYYELSDDGKLVLSGYPLPNIRALRQKHRDDTDFVFERHLEGLTRLEVIQVLISQLSLRTLHVEEPSSMRGLTSAMIYQPQNFPSDRAVQMEKAILINREIFALIKEKTAARHIPLVIVTAPTKQEYGGCKWVHEGDINRNSVNDLRRSLEGLNIPLIDTTEDLNCKDFWRFDGHWNVRGHLKMARAIEHWVPVFSDQQAGKNANAF